MSRRTAPNRSRVQAVLVWKKPIPQSRDRLQSRLLVWLLAPVLFGLFLQALSFAHSQIHAVHILFLEALIISFVFALGTWLLGAATPAAALCGAMVCLLITFFTGSGRLGPLRSGLTPLIELFILTFAATRAGRMRKLRDGLAESRHGRSAAQILANLGAAGLLSSAAGAWLVTWSSQLSGRFLFIPRAIPVLVLAVLAEATADTVSSEFGQAFGGEPILLTSFRHVPPGTDGAITLRGTLAGVLAAALVAAVAEWAMRLTPRLMMIALISSVAGLFFDSLIGATVERKGWVGNDLVNFSSTLFAALVALVVLLLASPRLS